MKYNLRALMLAAASSLSMNTASAYFETPKEKPPQKSVCEDHTLIAFDIIAKQAERANQSFIAESFIKARDAFMSNKATLTLQDKDRIIFTLDYASEQKVLPIHCIDYVVQRLDTLGISREYVREKLTR